MLLKIGQKVQPSDNPLNTFEFTVYFMIGDADWDGNTTVRVHKDNPRLDAFVEFLIKEHKSGKQYYFTERSDEFKSFTGDWDDYEGDYDEIDDPTPETPIMLDWFVKDGEYFGEITNWKATYFDENGIEFNVSL